MKRISKIAMCLLLAAIFSACNGLLLKKKAQVAPWKDMTRLSAVLDSAEMPPATDNSINTDAQYLYALTIADSLMSCYPEDSLLSTLALRISDSYDDYLHQYAVLDADTLSAEELLLDLESLYAISDSADFSLDSLQELRIPLVLNRKVENAIKFFTGTRKGRRVFQRWLERAGKYESLVKGILREEGAPEELFYLAMIESGLRPNVRSYAHAVGMWQFIAATGRYYDLNQSWWFDERRDVIKSTRAAGRHLLDLYERFGDWYIGIAGYNFSPGKIARRIKKYNVSEFWDLPRLPRQTRNYVPSYLAAVTIAGDPDKYGFTDITPEQPIEFDTVTVKQSMDLTVVAEAVGTTYKNLKELNPGILRWCTPPDVDAWLLYLPMGTRAQFLSKYDSLPKTKKMNWARHRIRSGETLSGIARRYGVAISEIRQFNKLRSNLIRAGRTLMIPIPISESGTARVAVSKQKRTARTSTPKSTPRQQVVADVPGSKKQVYTVRSGDSLWEVAHRHGTSVRQLQQWNGLGYSKIIQPGQKLNVWIKTSDTSSPAMAKAKLPAVRDAAASAANNTIHYTVRSGDTLWDIARLHHVSISDLKSWNGKQSNKIKPGEQLTIMAK